MDTNGLLTGWVYHIENQVVVMSVTRYSLEAMLLVDWIEQHSIFMPSMSQ